MFPGIHDWRELIRLKIYDNRDIILNSLRVIGMLVSSLALGSIIHFYGFPKTVESTEITRIIVTGSLIFYFVKFLLKLFLSLDWRSFVKESWIESTIMLVLFIFSTIHFIFQVRLIEVFTNILEIEFLESYTVIFIQLYFFIIFALELGKGSRFLANLQLGPSVMLSLSFVVLILSGTGLLMLPEMTTLRELRFVDALFTATSASCVTGLAVVDTGTYFTLKGQVIIMFLIQLGGINIISFATFFATFYRQTTGLKYQSLMKDFLSVEGFSDTRIILRKIFLFSLVIEAIGTVFIFLFWGNDLHFSGMNQKWFYSLFHSVSAFNNAGFSLLTNGLYELPVRYSYFLHLTVATLIFFGGIGFSTMQDMFGMQNIRDRFKNPWKKMSVNTRVVLYTSIGLIIIGAIIFYILERNNSLKGLSPFGTVVTCIFQSVTPRTAGFNTVDFTRLLSPTLIIIMFLMFVGASPGSTGGGIKTTTFAVIVKSAIATITGRKSLEFFRQSIKEEAIGKAYAIVLFSMSLIFFSSFVLTITDPGIPFLNLLFEEISAFGTVGLSTGITPGLSDGGKSILIASMFVGRIGTLTLALAVSRRVVYAKYKYATANLQIG